MSRAAKMIAERRLEILRFLVSVGGEENDRVVARVIRARGFYTTSAAEIAADIDYLEATRCVTVLRRDEVRMVALTPAGEDAAHGRGRPIDGINHSIWRR